MKLLLALCASIENLNKWEKLSNCLVGNFFCSVSFNFEINSAVELLSCFVMEVAMNCICSRTRESTVY